MVRRTTDWVFVTDATNGWDFSTSNDPIVSLRPKLVVQYNAAPTANPDSASVDEGASVVIDLAGNDTDPDNALDLTSIVITSGPSNGSVVVNGDGTVTYTHDGSETVGDAFSYTIRDASGATSNVAAVSLTVTPQNDAPDREPGLAPRSTRARASSSTWPGTTPTPTTPWISPRS